MLEMFCSVAPVATLPMSPEPIPSHDFSNDTLYEIELDVGGSNMRAYIVGMDDEFLIVECADKVHAASSEIYSPSIDTCIRYIPLHDIVDVNEVVPDVYTGNLD